MCESPNTPDPEKSELDKSSNNFQQNGRRQKNHDPARDISIQVLEKFSLVTRFARETTSQLFRESYQDSFSSKEGWKDAPLSPAYNHEAASNDSPKVPDEVSVAADPVEVINFFTFHLISVFKNVSLVASLLFAYYLLTNRCVVTGNFNFSFYWFSWL